MVLASGTNFGPIEPVAQGIWRWPYSQMEIGDSFLVHQEQRPLGAVRAYAAGETARLGRKFSVTTEGDYAKVTRVDPDETVSERQAAKAQLNGGDGEKYLGVLDPPVGERWAWPFAQMEPGQYFHVPHEARHPEKVRAFAMLRGSQLGIPLNVRGTDPEMPGYCRIEYLEGGRQLAKPQTNVDYELLNEIVQQHYGIHVEELDFWGLQGYHDETHECMFAQIDAPKNAKVVLNTSFAAFGFEFLPDRVRITSLPIGTTCESWLRGVRLIPQNFALKGKRSDDFGMGNQPEHGIFGLLRAQVDEQKKLDLLGE